MGGEHRCYGCDQLVGEPHNPGCARIDIAHKGDGRVTEADALYDPMPAAGPPRREAFVVMTALPGPGIASLVEEAIERTRDDGKNDLVRAVREAVAQGCEFVELEDRDGAGLGPSSGVDWEPHPNGKVWRLGPFLLP